MWRAQETEKGGVYFQIKIFFSLMGKKGQFIPTYLELLKGVLINSDLKVLTG